MAEPAILLTGATGLIGSCLARKMSQLPGYKVVCPARAGEFHPKASLLRSLGAILVPGSFFDENLIKEIFKQYRILKVVHLAAIRGGGKASPLQFQQVNVAGTEMLLHYALEHQVKSFIFCSSVGVYGTIPRSVPAGLETPLNGDNHYHQSKISAERAVGRYIDKGLNACIVRPTIAYGVEDDGFPRTLVNLVRRHLLWLPASNIRIHMVDVEFLAEVFLRLIQLEPFPARIFLAADAEPVLLKDLADWIHEYFVHSPYPDFFRLPVWFYAMTLCFFQRVKNEKWATRLMLITQNWHYQAAETYHLLGLEPSHTSQAFPRFLHSCFPPRDE